MLNRLKKNLFTFGLLAVLLSALFPAVANAARTDALWDYIQGGNYTMPNGSASGTNLLIYGLNHYINFGTVTGVNGYGVRDNGGTIECKNSGGSWAACSGGGGTGTVTSVDVSGGTTGLTTSGGPVTTSGTIILAGTLLVANGGTGSTTLTGILKGNGTNAIQTAVGNTDYQVPISLTTTGTSGAASFNGTTLNVPQYQAAGTYVTAVSVASANGLAGSSSGGTTPALTLSTTVTGIVKGNGTALSAAANGTDYTLITAKTCTLGDFVSAVTAAGVFTCTTPAGTTYTGTYPILVTGSVISTAFGTTTSNTFAGTQTFTNSPIFSTLGAGTVNSTAGGAIYNTATSTPTVTAPITYSGTLGSFIGGATGAFGCNVASGSQQGCLASADWTIFNNKISSTSLSGGTGITYTSSTGVILNTGVISNSCPGGFLSCSGTNPSAFTLGTLGVANGGTGTTTAPVGQIIYGGSGGPYQSAATTSVTCSGTASCTPFAVIGPSPITITGAGSATGLGTTSPWIGSGVAYRVSDGTVSTAATGTQTISSPLTGGPFTVLGSGGALGIQAASAVQNGYLSAIDYSLLHTATTTFTSPLIYTLASNTVTCQVATGSVPGCLSAADFTTFNGKQAAGNYITALTGDVTATGPGSVAATLATVNSNIGSFTNSTVTVNAKGLITAASNGSTPEVPLTFTWPLIRTTNTITFNGLSTSTAAVVGNIPYFSGVNTFANVATSSVSASTGIGFTGTAGALVGGTSLTITNTGVTSLAGTANQITASASTGAVTLSFPNLVVFPSNASSTLFSTVYGSTTNAFVGTLNLPNISGTQCLHSISGIVSGTGSDCGSGGGITGSTGQVAYFSGTNTAVGTSTLFITGASAVGLGTLTPAAKFDVQGTTSDATSQIADFWKADGTTVMRIRSDGNVGIGTTSPYAKLSIDAPSTALPFFAIGSSTGEIFKVQSSTGNATFSLGGGPTNAQWNMFNVAGNLFFASSTAGITSTSTFPNPNIGFIEFPADGGCIGCTDIHTAVGIDLRNGKYLVATSSAITAYTRQDIYTVPTGRRAMFTGYVSYNGTVGTPTYRFFAKISGTYYAINATSSSGATGFSGGGGSGFILEPGESLAVWGDTTSNAYPIRASLIEYSSSVPFKSVRSLAPSGTATTTLYTVPAGVTAVVLPQNILNAGAATANAPGVVITNSTGAAFNYKEFVVQSGQVPTDNLNTDRLALSIAAGGTTSNSWGTTGLATGFGMNSGDSISYWLSATAGTNGIIWVNLAEH